MKLMSKSMLLAAGAATLVATAPVQARGGYGDHDGVDTGDVIAGALILGGIAAIASAGSSRGDRYDDRRYGRDYGRGGYDNGYGYDRGRGYGSRTAVDQCVRAAQQEARRYGWARVTDVTSIDRIRDGFQVRGRLVVEQRGYGGRWRGGEDRYGNNYDRYNDGYDRGRFSCVTRYGRIEDVRLAGLRGGY